MSSKVAPIIIAICSSFALSAQSVSYSEFVQSAAICVDSFGTAEGYYIFYQVPSGQEPLDIVVFVHGFGALNPMVYGKWIEHLVAEGNAVIYVRYQQGLLSTSTSDFVPNTIAAIRSAMGYIREASILCSTTHIDLIGHSYGGVIAANIAARYSELDAPTVRVAMLCEPGTGPFSGALLESYDVIDKDVYVPIIVGDDDFTVGQKIGLRVLETAVNTPVRVLFWQYADENGEEAIEASHYEPYSYDVRFDNGISNFTVQRAARVSQFNQVDTLGYWQVFDTFQELAKNNVQPGTELLKTLGALGEWSDGSAIRPMEVRQQ